MRKGLHKLDRPWWKIAGRAPMNYQRAQNLVLRQQWHDQNRAKARRQDSRSERKITRLLQVGNGNRMFSREASPRTVSSSLMRVERILLFQVLFERMPFGKLEQVASSVISIDCPRIRLRELNCPCHNGGKHGLGVERRGHCTPDLFERLEFAHGLRELARPPPTKVRRRRKHKLAQSVSEFKALEGIGRAVASSLDTKSVLGTDCDTGGSTHAGGCGGDLSI